MIRVATWNIWQYMVPWGYTPARGVVPGHAFSGSEQPGPLETWLLRREVILSALRTAGPDVVLLQECAGDPAIAPDLPNQAEQIAAGLGYRCFYRPMAPRHPGQAAELGLAILVRPDWPASVVLDLDLPWENSHPKDVPRAALWCRVQTPDGLLDCVCTHLSLDPASRLRSVTILDRLLRVLSVMWRERGEEYPPLTLDDLLGGEQGVGSRGAGAQETEGIGREHEQPTFLSGEPGAGMSSLVPTPHPLLPTPSVPLGLILGGDFNAQPHELPMQRLRRAWFRWPDEEAHRRALERFANWPDPWLDLWDTLEPDDPGHTFPTPDPFLRFDYLFLHPVGRLRPAAITMLGDEPGESGLYGSDHLGLLAELS